MLVLPGSVVIDLDVSGSTTFPVTGWRGDRSTSKMLCVDAAALFAAAILRRNPESIVIPFDTKAFDVRVDPGDTILSLVKRLSQYGGGGTNCSLPLAVANRKHRNRRLAGCVLVSDNESWVGSGRHGSSGVMAEWQQLTRNQSRLATCGTPSPKLICIDLQPYGTAQAPDRDDILNVGGFSDAVFDVVAAFLADDTDRFIADVEAIKL